MDNPKRIKLDNDDIMTIRSIVADNLINLPSLVKYYVGKIADQKDISRVMCEINKVLPTNHIQFVKRVNRNNEILICSEELFKEILIQMDITFINDVSVVKDLLKKVLIEKGLKDELAELVCFSIKTINIPNTQPLLRWQFDELNSSWPCKFHENKYLEQLTANAIFSKCDLRSHTKFMQICKFLSFELNGLDVGLAVNPYNKNIVALGFSKLYKNPIHHCSMELIDQVAITQNGGAWSKAHDEQYEMLIEKVSRVFDVKFGEEEFDKISAAKKNPDDNLIKYGPYLCTGYEIYLLNEPCLMCSMSLVHSRAKRVYYNKSNLKLGALGSLTKLHTNRNLNHRYEAFHIT
ncbi:unnamed protein product [Diamesa serratosioi]